MGFGVGVVSRSSMEENSKNGLHGWCGVQGEEGAAEGQTAI